MTTATQRPAPEPLVWRRLRPGLYETMATADVNGYRTSVRVWAREIPEWDAGVRWAVEAWYLDASGEWPLIRADDGPVPLLRDAKASAADAIRRGWAVHPGLGLCLRSDPA